MTRRSLAAPQTPAAALLALALAASASVGALPAAGQAPVPLERVVVLGTHAAADVVRAGGSLVEQLPLVGGVGALLPRGAALPAADVVVPDRPLSVSSTTAPAGKGTTLRATLGLGAPQGEGRGVTVAVVDTGVSAAAPGLAGRVEHVSVVGDAGQDDLGHGTFIAGLIAGDGAGAGPAYAGVAPGARVLDVKVAGEDGETSLLDVLRGLQRVSARGGVDVLNLSLSSGSPLPTAMDPLALALDRLWADGVTVVVPSGNDAETVSSPGSDPLLLTVGGLAEGGTADRDDDAVADWSGRGRSKPDLVAPGQSVVSTLAPGSSAEGAQRATGLPRGYGVGSGSSFSTAVVSGTAAALLSRRDLTPGQVKELVTDSAYRVGKGARRAGSGAGGLDVAAALTARTPKDRPAAVDALPGRDLAAWEAFVAAVLDDDQAAAASSWSRLSASARQWAARQWASLDDDGQGWAARQWAARQWAARQWAGDGADSGEWLARQWAARQWAARQWADGDWSARQWSARQWSARQWSGEDWSARQWSARQWSARQWSTASWS